jgi:aspartate carbamoyltransferase catalytic subunit
MAIANRPNRPADLGGLSTGGPRHILESQQFSRDLLDEIFDRADAMRADPRRAASRLQGRIMAALFYEPSTRTRLSFESAMLRLGGRTIGTDNAREFSSAAKGETLEDTVRVLGGYADVIVLRHHEQGAAVRAASVSDVPVINAGDGKGQHPTQALLDLYTIKDELGRVDGVRVAIVGDLANGRTARSLAYLLSKYKDVELWFVAPGQVQMGQDIKDHLNEYQVRWQETSDLDEVLPTVDVVYQTRIQKERFADDASYQAVRGVYVVDQDTMGRLSPYAIVMHPLPRVDEIDPAIDSDPRAAYFRQARNGVQIRMALLDMVVA